MNRIVTDTYTYADPRIRQSSERMNWLIQEAAMRRGRRIHREFEIALRPGWLGSINWHFPTFRVRTRPFDYMRDQTDIPVEPSPPPPHPEQARLRLYLRAAAPVVQR